MSIQSVAPAACSTPYRSLSPSNEPASVRSLYVGENSSSSGPIRLSKLCSELTGKGPALSRTFAKLGFPSSDEDTKRESSSSSSLCLSELEQRFLSEKNGSIKVSPPPPTSDNGANSQPLILPDLNVASIKVSPSPPPSDSGAHSQPLIVPDLQVGSFPDWRKICGDRRTNTAPTMITDMISKDSSGVVSFSFYLTNFSDVKSTRDVKVRLGKMPDLNGKIEVHRGGFVNLYSGTLTTTKSPGFWQWLFGSKTETLKIWTEGKEILVNESYPSPKKGPSIEREARFNLSETSPADALFLNEFKQTKFYSEVREFANSGNKRILENSNQKRASTKA